MENLFLTSTPEELGIKSEWMINFLDRLNKQDLPVHSAIIMRHDRICMEAYYKPYTRDTLHRMFSITKSLVSIGIGLLEEEGKLSLDDHIVDYFPEKLPKNGAYKYTKMLTIRQMLAMTTCHDKTTYKANDVTDWVGSFFTVKPNHVPGTNFAYDTSSTHVLGALIEKLSGMELLEYLRVKFLNELGFSKDAYILKDPYGVPLGGSGLCATPYDILKVIYLIANDGKMNGKQLLPAEYIKAAKTKQSDPYGKQSTLEEIQGYGYQIWMTRHNGYVMFGMGGQLALYVPDKDIFMVTTCDAQGRQGGVQLIYESFWNEIYNKISDTPFNENKESFSRLNEFCNSLKIFTMPGELTSPIIDNINNAFYICDENACGVKNVSVHFDNNECGTFYYENGSGKHEIKFGIGENVIQQFPDYDLKCAVSGAWRLDSYFLIKVQIIDSAIGNIYMGLNFKDEYITVMFRKIEESLFNEYSGVFSGKRNL